MKRPVLVTVISIVMIVMGALQLLVGIAAFANRNDKTFLVDAGRTSSEVTAFGLAVIAIGLISIVLAIGLLGGNRVARGVVGIFEVLQIAGGIWALFWLDSGYRSTGIGQIIGGLVVLYFLFGTAKAKAFFSR